MVMVLAEVPPSGVFPKSIEDGLTASWPAAGVGAGVGVGDTCDAEDVAMLHAATEIAITATATTKKVRARFKWPILIAPYADLTAFYTHWQEGLRTPHKVH
jgi:hypothetical protein